MNIEKIIDWKKWALGKKNWKFWYTFQQNQCNFLKFSLKNFYKFIDSWFDDHAGVENGELTTADPQQVQNCLHVLIINLIVLIADRKIFATKSTKICWFYSFGSQTCDIIVDEQTTKSSISKGKSRGWADSCRPVAPLYNAIRKEKCLLAKALLENWSFVDMKTSMKTKTGETA